MTTVTKMGFKFEPRDLWIGVYWNRYVAPDDPMAKFDCHVCRQDHTQAPSLQVFDHLPSRWQLHTLDLYITIIPMLPFHIRRSTTTLPIKR